MISGPLVFGLLLGSFAGETIIFFRTGDLGLVFFFLLGFFWLGRTIVSSFDGSFFLFLFFVFVFFFLSRVFFFGPCFGGWLILRFPFFDDDGMVTLHLDESHLFAAIIKDEIVFVYVRRTRFVHSFRKRDDK